MIYQHRLIVARSGRLEKRNEIFQREMLAALDEHGSLLIGAWEVLIGPETGSGVYQLRQFESLSAWERHQENVRRDRQTSGRQGKLYPSLDAVDTAIVRSAERAAPLPVQWPGAESLQAMPRGIFEPGGIDQREVQIAKPAKAFAAVAGDARLIVDQREPPSDQPVEQRRFADIGPADNHDFWNHETILTGHAHACALSFTA
jgi:hypothetical protein